MGYLIGASIAIAFLAIVIFVIAKVVRRSRSPSPQQTTATQGSPPSKAKVVEFPRWKRVVSAFNAVILLFLAGWLVFYLLFKSGGDEKREEPQMTISANHLSDNDIPMEVFLPVCADCESGDGTPGSGRHKDNEGNVILGKINKKDVGKWQINTDKQAALIAELKADPFEEKDNQRIAEVLYQRQGARPWYLSQDCWQRRLGEMGYKPTTGMIKLEAPVGTFSEWVNVEPGTSFSWGNPQDSFIIQNQKGYIARFDPSRGIKEDLLSPTSSFRVKSAMDRPVEVRIDFWKYGTPRPTLQGEAR